MEKTKTGRGKLFAAIGAAAVIIAAAVILFFATRQEGYRTIRVSELLGGVVAEDARSTYDAYVNMHLREGSALTTDHGSYARMVLDDDKYVRLEEDSRAAFEALGRPGSGKTTIDLERGVLTNELTRPLGKDESYVVNTPNAVLAVRGTFFRVEVREEESGEVLTDIYTYGGAVTCSRILPDGSVMDEQVIIEKGYKTTVSMDSVETVYIVEKIVPDKEHIEPIVQENIPDRDMIDMYEASMHDHAMFLPIEAIWTHIERRGIDIDDHHSQYDQMPIEPYTATESEPTAPTEEPTPPVEELTPPVEEPTPPVEEPTPPTEESTPPTEEPTPPVEEPTAPTEDPTPPTEEPTPPTEEPTPPVEEPTPPTEEPTPPVEEDPPSAPEEDASDGSSSADPDSSGSGSGGSSDGNSGSGGSGGSSDSGAAVCAHTNTTTDTTNATCTAAGSTVVTCVDCGTEISNTTIPASGHTAGEPVFEKLATCSEEGKKTTSCSVCGEEISSQTLEKLPHTEKENVISTPDCTNDGEVEVICDICGDFIRTVVIDAAGHTPKTTTTPATCTVDGSTVIACETCGEEISNTPIPATGHSETTTTTATCAAAGVKTTSCSVCSEVIEEVFDPMTDDHSGDDVCTVCAAVKISSTNNFADATFQTYAASFDTDSDGYLESGELASATSITLTNAHAAITSLDGIEHFTSLDTLSITDCTNLVYLSLSGNTALETLTIINSAVGTLDLSNNTALETVEIKNSVTEMTLGTGDFPNLELTFRQTPLRYFDFLSNCSVKTVYFYEQTVVSWDLKTIKADKVHIEQCSTIPSGTLDFSGNQTLKSVWVENMLLTELNLSDCTNLTQVVPGYSQALTVEVIDLRNCTGITQSVDFSMVNQYSNCTVYINGSALADNPDLYNTGGVVTINNDP